MIALTVCCDMPECWNTWASDYETTTMARTQARAEGWTNPSRGRDVCPLHSTDEGGEG